MEPEMADEIMALVFRNLANRNLDENYTGILLYALKDGASIAFANRLHTQSENVDCCIEISVHSQTTFRAAMDSFREIFFDYHTTPRTHLRSVLGINQDNLGASICCFALG